VLSDYICQMSIFSTAINEIAVYFGYSDVAIQSTAVDALIRLSQYGMCIFLNLHSTCIDGIIDHVHLATHHMIDAILGKLEVVDITMQEKYGKLLSALLYAYSTFPFVLYNLYCMQG